jgi:hypothetical protein
MTPDPSPNLPLRGTMAEILGGMHARAAEAEPHAFAPRTGSARLGPDWVAEDLTRIEHALARLEAAIGHPRR